MKRKILAIFFFLIFASFLPLNAQWARSYGGSEDDHASSILQTFDGGYIIAGSTKSFGAGDYDFLILKLTSDGTLEWQKTFGDYLDDYANSIQQTNDGGYIIAGRLAIYGTGRNIWIIKLSSDGNVEWQKFHGDPLQCEANSIQQTNDGGYIVAGQIWPSKNTPSNFWILKLFAQGEIEWKKSYGGSQTELANSIQQTSDGGYIVAGNTQSFGAGSSDIWILKINSVGDIEWQKTSGGSQTEVANSIQQTSDGGYIVAGQTGSFGAGSSDVWILKINSVGDIEWQKTYGGSQVEEASSIQQTYDGGYIAAASTDSYGTGLLDFMILKLFSNGDIDPICGFIKESNAEVSDTSIIPADTAIVPEDIAITSGDTRFIPLESEVFVYRLCSGQHTLSITTSSGGTTIPQPGIYIYDHAERIDLSAKPDEGYIFVGWSGDISSTDASLSITMDSDKSIKANFSEDIIDEIVEEIKKAPCFIATAAFGSPFHPYVRTLQDFKDKYLMSNRPGRMFVKFYYKYSPSIAKLITKHKILRTGVSIWLVPFVALGYSMVHFGPVKTTMMFGLSFIPLFIFVWFLRRKGV